MSLYKFFPKIPKITNSTSKEILNSASELIAQPAQASPSTTTENPIQITTETVIEKDRFNIILIIIFLIFNRQKHKLLIIDNYFEIININKFKLIILINLMIDFGILMSNKYIL